MAEQCKKCGNEHTTLTCPTWPFGGETVTATIGHTFARAMLYEGHPDAVWNDDIGAWMESDEAFRRRIKATIEGPKR